jgi:hypothetical protein
MLVASLQLSASQTLLSIYRSQLISSPSSSFQSLHLFSCPSIENGIIFGSLLSNSLKSIQRLFEFPTTDSMIRLSAVRSVVRFGEFLATLRRQDFFLHYKEIQLFEKAMTSQLEEIFQLWIQMIDEGRVVSLSLELMRDCLTAMVRYGTRETSQTLQLMLHTKLLLPPSGHGDDGGDPVEVLGSQRREFTRGLVLCAQRSYVETLQVIATAAQETTFLKLAEESGGGSLSGLLSLSQHPADEENQPGIESEVISDWISHLVGVAGVQNNSLESFVSSQKFVSFLRFVSTHSLSFLLSFPLPPQLFDQSDPPQGNAKGTNLHCFLLPD